MVSSAGSIFLVGPMGAGKSTLGRLLADCLGWSFVDADRVIEERAGADIPWIFDLEGEAGFRQRESQVLEDLTRLSGQVLATGGGAVIRPENRAVLSERGTVVYLRTSIAVQLRRTSKDRNRPLLQKPDPEKVLTDLLHQREPFYLAIADIVVDTDDSHPRALADHIIDIYRQGSNHKVS